MEMNTVGAAFDLLRDAGAPAKLVRHAELVGEAAEALLAALLGQGVPLDQGFVRIGVVLHDIGKAIHQSELARAGSEHEPAGERLLLQRGVDPRLARVCRSHAQWASLDPALEELVIALADKLWKGVRTRDLEELVIDRAAAAANRERWDLFVMLDAAFEEIASAGDERLARSHA